MVKASTAAVNECEAVAIGVSFSHQVSTERSIVMQTHVARDSSDTLLNAVLDKMRDAIDRQVAGHRVKELRKSLEMQKKQLRRVKEDLIRIDAQSERAWLIAGKKGPYKPANELVQHRENARVTEERFKEEIRDIENEIAAMEAVQNADSGANR